MADGEICITRSWQEKVCGGIMSTGRLNPHRPHFMPRIGCDTVTHTETTCEAAASSEDARAIFARFVAQWKLFTR